MNTTVNSYKASVRLADIVPADENPRKDFGDISGLADKIRATGGQPVNPIVVVRDGSRFRIVDGERRYRALREIHGEQGSTDALVFGDYSKAHSAVAMLATDDKKPLTDEEQARGFQEMLRLGVDEQIVANAVNRRVSDVRMARSVAADAPEQATLDQMIAAAEFEGRDRMAVLKAKPGAWSRRAESIRRRIEGERQAEEFKAEFERMGVATQEHRPDKHSYVAFMASPADVEAAVGRGVERYDISELVASPTYSGWYLDGPQRERQLSEEERMEMELHERRIAATADLRKALVRAIASTDAMPKTQGVAGLLRGGRYERWERDRFQNALKSDVLLPDHLVAELVDSPMSMYELARYVLNNVEEWWLWITDIVPLALEECDFTLSEEDAWLLEQAQTEVAKRKAKDADA